MKEGPGGVVFDAEGVRAALEGRRQTEGRVTRRARLLGEEVSAGRAGPREAGGEADKGVGQGA